MEVNIYDFDGTIYDGDSSIDFFKFSIKHNKKILLCIPKIIIYYCLYFFKIKTKTEVKQCFFSFLRKISDIDSLVENFWLLYKKKIKKFYMNKTHDNDIIISASPEFLLENICKQLKVKDLIGSNVDKKNGKFLGCNCKGMEKVRRFKEKYPNAIVNEVYTDSLSDQPIIDIAKTAYIVNKNNLKLIKK